VTDTGHSIMRAVRRLWWAGHVATVGGKKSIQNLGGETTWTTRRWEVDRNVSGSYPMDVAVTNVEPLGSKPV